MSIHSMRLDVRRPVTLSAPDLPHWTPIAKLRPNGKGPRWNPVPDAPVKPCEARRMEERGVLLMAHRVQDDGTYLVVKTPITSLRCKR